jgi:hypothetical protein
LAFAGADYKGYMPNPQGIGEPIAPTGLLLSNGGSIGSSLSTERLLEYGSAAPTPATTTTTATNAFKVANWTIGLTSCTGFTAQGTTIVDTTLLATGDVLGFGNGCISSPQLNLTAAAAAASVGTRDALYAEPGVSTPATAAFYTNQTTIAVTSCAGVLAGQTVLDGTVPLGVVSACDSVGLLLTLTTYIAVGSTGAADVLTFAVALIAQDSWATNMTAIPVATCPTGGLALTSGEPVVNSAGVTIGTVGAGLCASAPRLSLKQPSGFNSSGAGDTIVAMGRRKGDFRFSTLAAAGGTLGWSSMSDAAPTYNPAGPISNDTAGNTWTFNAVISGGTKPVNSGTCLINTQLGGAAAGSFKANGACAGTLVFTMPAAPNGWTCDAHDLTTPADLISQTSYGVAQAAFAATMAASDLATFRCAGF